MIHGRLELIFPQKLLLFQCRRAQRLPCAGAPRAPTAPTRNTKSEANPHLPPPTIGAFSWQVHGNGARSHHWTWCKAALCEVIILFCALFPSIVTSGRWDDQRIWWMVGYASKWNLRTAKNAKKWEHLPLTALDFSVSDTTGPTTLDTWPVVSVEWCVQG